MDAQKSFFLHFTHSGLDHLPLVNREGVFCICLQEGYAFLYMFEDDQWAWQATKEYSGKAKNYNDRTRQKFLLGCHDLPMLTPDALMPFVNREVFMNEERWFRDLLLKIAANWQILWSEVPAILAEVSARAWELDTGAPSYDQVLHPEDRRWMTCFSLEKYHQAYSAWLKDKSKTLPPSQEAYMSRHSFTWNGNVPLLWKEK